MKKRWTILNTQWMDDLTAMSRKQLTHELKSTVKIILKKPEPQSERLTDEDCQAFPIMCMFDCDSE